MRGGRLGVLVRYPAAFLIGNVLLVLIGYFLTPVTRYRWSLESYLLRTIQLGSAYGFGACITSGLIVRLLALRKDVTAILIGLPMPIILLLVPEYPDSSIPWTMEILFGLFMMMGAYLGTRLSPDGTRPSNVTGTL
jgi:hypothetical protein